MQEIGRTARSVAPTAKRILTQSWGQNLSLRLLVLLQGVIFQNSPAWNIHPLMCENIILDDVLARNPSFAQNGDALDLESCKNALIVNSKFDAGDDGIDIKNIVCNGAGRAMEFN